MGVNEEFGDEVKVCIAYGSAQRTSSKPGAKSNPCEFELDAGEGGNKLTEQTRFDCYRHVWLPYEVKWFCKDGKMGSTYGVVPASRTDEIR